VLLYFCTIMEDLVRCRDVLNRPDRTLAELVDVVHRAEAQRLTAIAIRIDTLTELGHALNEAERLGGSGTPGQPREECLAAEIRKQEPRADYIRVATRGYFAAAKGGK
jgi:hypothetical protein